MEIIGILVLVLVFILGALKRQLIDKRIYRLHPHVKFEVADQSLKRIYLPFKLWCQYYSGIWFICVFAPFFGVMFSFIAFYLENNTTLKMIQNLSIAFVSFSLPIILWRKSVNGLKFRETYINTPKNESYVIIKNQCEESGWDILNKKENDFIQIQTFGSPTSRGELVTVVFNDNLFLVNSIASPYKKSSILTFGNNKSNIDYFSALCSNKNE